MRKYITRKEIADILECTPYSVGRAEKRLGLLEFKTHRERPALYKRAGVLAQLAKLGFTVTTN